MPKDEFDIEYDEDVEKALKDPKGGLLAKCVDYLTKHNAAKAKKEAEDQAKKDEANKDKGIFGSSFPF